MKKKVFVFMFRLIGGGAERTVVNIVNSLDKSKYEIILVLGSRENNDYIHEVSQEVDIRYLGFSRLRYCLIKLIKLIKKEKPDILFTTMFPNITMLYMAKAFSGQKAPLIIRESNNRTESGKVSLVNKLTTFLIYNKSTGIIALSKGVRQDLIENFKVNPDKIQVIYNPVDANRILDLKEKKVDIDFLNDEKIIISIGRLEEQKDYITLLKAFKQVRSEMKAKLLILGKGSLENELKDFTYQLGLSEDVLFMGFQKNPYKYLAIADIFLLTSQWEGFGHVIVEAMSVGTPVIVTDCKSGPSEILDNGKYGVLTEVGNSNNIAINILEMLKSERKMQCYSQQGLKRAKEFDSKLIILKYDDYFSSFLSR